MSISVLRNEANSVIVWYGSLFSVVLTVDRRTSDGRWNLHWRRSYIKLQIHDRLGHLSRRVAASSTYRLYWRVRHWAF